MNNYGVTDKFLIFVDSLIDQFEHMLKENDFIDRDFTEEEAEKIRIDICNHVTCLDDWDDEIPCIEIYYYRDYSDNVQNISIECNNCNTVIVDSEIFEYSTEKDI